MKTAIILVLVAALCMVNYTNALKSCYRCSECKSPFKPSDAEIIDCTTSCSKTIEGGKTYRACTPGCAPVSDNTRVRLCCNDKDNCNSFEVMKANKFVLSLFGITSILVYLFAK